MVFTDKIKNTVGRAVLRKNLKKLIRKRHISNLSTAKTVGVVFSPFNKTDLKTVKGFLAYLTNLDIKVVPMAIVDMKNSDIETVMEQTINFVEKKDFNWFHKPLSPIVRDFIDKDFDILINLCMKMTLPIDYVMGLSKAKFKTGKLFENGNTCCDLMIDVKESDNLPYLIEQTSHYLSVINNAK